MGSKVSIATCNSADVIVNDEMKVPKVTLRGDLSMKAESQNERKQRMIEHQKKISSKAEELSDRVLEEKDRLSLHSKSRGTSRTTSRTASPSNNRKHVHFEPKTNYSELQDTSGNTSCDSEPTKDLTPVPENLIDETKVKVDENLNNSPVTVET